MSEGIRKVTIDGVTTEFRAQAAHEPEEKCYFCGIDGPVWQAQVGNWQIKACAQSCCQEQAVRKSKKLGRGFDRPAYFGSGAGCDYGRPR